jgi:hypothetical protein
MKELDLHGMIHVDVELEVKNFLFLNWNNFPIKIITGRSERMRNLVIDILNKNDYTYDIPAHNFGEIIVLY